MVYLSDTNQLGDLTHSARPDIVAGVPLVNPLYSSSCPIGARLPALSESLGVHAPGAGPAWATRRERSIACADRGQQFFDMSVQKNFNLGESGKRRLQFRVDALNVFNHPTFAVYPNNAGGADFMGAPSTATLTTAAYNTWATANGQPHAKHHGRSGDL